MVGQVFSHFRIIDKIGAGGMGVVFRAEDVKLGRQVALKFLPSGAASHHERVERFRREARTASALSHPNICTIFEIDEHEGQVFIAMELLDGETLDHRLGQRPFPLPLVIDVAIQLADALDAAHSQAIVHRDIKPANLFLTRRGPLKVLDFGLAKVAQSHLPGRVAVGSDAQTSDADAAFVTSAGVGAMGTISYMSPEQARGEELDVRTDLFSFGVVLYEMATGRQTFPGPTTAVIFDAILNRTPEAPSTFNPEISPELERIIGKALEKDRGLRYQTAADVRADLQRLKRDSGRVAPAVPLAALGGSTPEWTSANRQSSSGSSGWSAPQTPSSAIPAPPVATVPTVKQGRPVLALLLGAAALVVLLAGAVVGTFAFLSWTNVSSSLDVSRETPPTGPAAADTSTTPSTTTPSGEEIGAAAAAAMTEAVLKALVPSTPPESAPAPRATPEPEPEAVSKTTQGPQPAPEPPPLPPTAQQERTRSSAASRTPVPPAIVIPTPPAPPPPPKVTVPGVENDEATEAAAIATQIAGKSIEEALSAIQSQIERRPPPRLAGTLSFQMAEIYRKQGKLDEALSAYRETSTRSPGHPRAPEALYRQAELILAASPRRRTTEAQLVPTQPLPGGQDVYDRAKAFMGPRSTLGPGAARQVLNELVTSYPNSEWALRGLELKVDLEERFDVRERDAVLAMTAPASIATNRLIVERSPTAPAAEQALWKLAESYQQLRRFDLAADALITLGTRFPNTTRDAWFRAGDLFESRLSDPAKANEAYAKVPRSSPSFEEAQKRLARSPR